LFIDVFNRTSYVYLFFNGKSYENPMKCYVSMGNPMKILCFNGKSYENPMKSDFPMETWGHRGHGGHGGHGFRCLSCSRVVDLKGW
jgi:hypothetical protein